MLRQQHERVLLGAPPQRVILPLATEDEPAPARLLWAGCQVAGAVSGRIRTRTGRLLGRARSVRCSRQRTASCQAGAVQQLSARLQPA